MVKDYLAQVGLGFRGVWLMVKDYLVQVGGAAPHPEGYQAGGAGYPLRACGALGEVWGTGFRGQPQTPTSRLAGV
jgi:hypothetical protein